MEFLSSGHYDCFHCTRARCTVWMIIWMTVFFTVCMQNYIVMRNCAIQMTVPPRNRRMNALTSNLWFGGRAMWPSNHFRLYIQGTAYVQKHRKRELHACLIGRVPRHEPHIFSRSGMLNRKFGLSCVHCIVQISQLLLSCVHCVIQFVQFEWSFNLRTLLSCENCLHNANPVLYKSSGLLVEGIQMFLGALFWQGWAD